MSAKKRLVEHDAILFITDFLEAAIYKEVHPSGFKVHLHYQPGKTAMGETHHASKIVPTVEKADETIQGWEEIVMEAMVSGFIRAGSSSMEVTKCRGKIQEIAGNYEVVQ